MSTTGVASTETPIDSPAPYRRRWAALFVILAAEVMDLLDAVVTNIAGPSMRADLGGGASTLQWLAAAYTLSMAVGSATSTAAAGCSWWAPPDSRWAPCSARYPCRPRC
jgi:MFS family permease